MPARKFTLKVRPKLARSRVDYERELNPQQLAVVTAGEGPILVIAGAGSGKTRAITYRVAYLLECGIPPERILLVTFTNKAAREMLHRVEILIESETKRLWGGTFHHVGNLVLRRHARQVGYESNFTILDREDTKSLFKTCVAELDLKRYPRRLPSADVLESIHSFAANTMQSVREVIPFRFPQFEGESEIIEKIIEKFEERKRNLNFMDYDDLLLNWLTLLRENEDILKFWSDRFLFILVDEYQDTNRIQGEVIDLLASSHRNLTVVGDDAQSIYRFRGASFENTITFPERYPDAKIFRLEINYRSTPEILELANASISHNKRQFPKKLEPVKKSGPLPALVPCRDVYQQADFVAQYILQLLEEGRSLNEVAILFRSHYLSMELQVELMRRNIPYIVRGGPRFFEQAHIKDLVSYLRIIVNPFDELSWMRILTLLPRIGAATARKLYSYLSSKEDPLAAIASEDTIPLVPKVARDSFKDLVEIISKLRSPEMAHAPTEMILTVLEGRYEDYLKNRYPNFAQRREDILQLANFALQYKSAESLLSELALLGEVTAEYVTFGPTETESVTLSTVHQAKGLEWPVVFVIGLADGRFPSQMALREPDAEEEERRIFYVAVTRTKEELYLTLPIQMRERGIGDFFVKRSRFITELDGKTYEVMELEEVSQFPTKDARISAMYPRQERGARFRLERSFESEEEEKEKQ